MLEKITIALVIGVGVVVIGGVILFLSKKYFSNMSLISALETQNVSLANENADLKAQISKLQKIIENLESRLLIYEDKKTILANYINHEFGYYIHKETKKPFCPNCLQNFNPPRENPLTESKQYLDCASCDYNHLKNPANLSDLGGIISNLHRTDDI